jgi:hypothetical protein
VAGEGGEQQSLAFTNIAADQDLAGLSAEPRFKELATTLDKQRRPCMYSTLRGNSISGSESGTSSLRRAKSRHQRHPADFRRLRHS